MRVLRCFHCHSVCRKCAQNPGICRHCQGTGTETVKLDIDRSGW
ncbi:MAG: hypothetical protein Q4F85_14770 [Prevotella sp.]|nr:hypothetical protein [Prevotella sp.]